MKKELITLFLMVVIIQGQQASSQSVVHLRHIGTHSLNGYNVGAAEISAYDKNTKKLFIVNGATGDIDMLNISNPSTPVFAGSIDLALWGKSANSIDIHNNVVAVAVEDTNKQANGRVVFFNTQGQFIKYVTVGALPDMLKFSPDGKTIVVACEGEPNDSYTVDPPGIVSIIDIPNIHAVKQSKVKNLDFSAYNNSLPAGIRKFGPNATVAQDMEPEYVAISADSRTAWVTLQENNAIAIIDLKHERINSLKPLGFKDHSINSNALDASDMNSGNIDIKMWPVFGIYEPDAIDAFKVFNNEYIIVANEGDTREYGGFNEIKRVGSLTLDPIAFPNAVVLKNNNNLGRLNVTNTLGDIDNDGDYDQLYSFGARSFSIRDKDGNLVWDSGDLLEQITAQQLPAFFNCSNSNNIKKNRSDDKGPEPEGLIVGEILDSVYVFVGLERIGGVMVFNITDPSNPYFVEYVNTRNFTQSPGLNSGGDLGPEGMLFIEADISPNNKNLLITSNEVSGTISIFETDYLCDNDKVRICDNGTQRCISESLLGNYLSNGATLGNCVSPRLASQKEIPLSVKIYPNPANDKLKIELPTELGETFSVYLYDMSQRLIDFKIVTPADGKSFEYDTRSLTNGIYFLGIPELMLPTKIVIQH